MGSPGGDDDSTSRPTRLPVQPPKPGTAMSLFILLFGLTFAGVGGYSYVAESASLDDNVAVTAEVTDIGVEQVSGSRGRYAYVPTVTFRYRFRGTNYTSDRLYTGVSQPRYDDRASALSRLSAYSVGQNVTAYVDPDTPGEAYLENSRSGQATGAFFAGVIMSLLGGIGLYQARRQARNRERLSS